MAYGQKILKGDAYKRAAIKRRHIRIRKHISGTAERPRLVVTRSNRHIVAQVIDDIKGHTLASASTLDTTIRGNEATGFGYGGGVSVLGPAFVAFSMIDSNTAAYGAGLEFFGGDVGPGELRIVNSTIAANHARSFSAGIESAASLDLYNSTVAFNTADRADGTNHAGGIVMQGAHVLNLVSSIVARNQQGGVAHDIGGSGSITGSANLVMSSTLPLPGGTLSADPLLIAAIGNYGGQTDTLGLQPGSPAIDAGSNPLGTSCDQRAGSYLPPFNLVGLYERQHGTGVDIGAFESGAGDALFGDGFEEITLVFCRP
jgi:hypothetical protein